MRTRGQEAKVTKLKTRARSRQSDPVALSTPNRKATRSTSNLSARSEIIVGKASPTKSPSLRGRRRARVSASWKSPRLRIHGLNRRFLESLEKSLSDEEQDGLTKDQTSLRTSPGHKEQAPNNLIERQEPAEDRIVDTFKNEESTQEITASTRQSPVSEAPVSNVGRLQPANDLQEKTQNSPDPSHQIEEELRQRANREREKNQGPAIEAPSVPGSPKNDVEQASTSSRSSLKEKESSVEGPLISEKAKVASVEMPLIIVDEELTEADLPPAFQAPLRDVAEEDCEDNADYIVKTRFAPMTGQEDFINVLTKTNPQQRPMEILYAIAENTQAALKLWQDEYLAIDKRTAPHANIPRRPAVGARLPIDPEIFDDMRESEIYGYTFDPKKIGHQNPFTQRSARGLKGRELRERRNRDLLETLGLSEDDAGAGPGRRTRKPTQKVEGNISTAGTTPETTRKRGIASVTPDTDAGGGSGPPKKRGKRGNAATRSDLLNPRIREMRAGSALTTTTEDETEGDDGEGDGDERDGLFRASTGPSGPPKRRGRPKGSKNLQKRPDAGIKKGPRGTWNKKLLPIALSGIQESRGTSSAAESPEKTFDIQPQPQPQPQAQPQPQPQPQLQPQLQPQHQLQPTYAPSGPSTLAFTTQPYLSSFPVDTSAGPASAPGKVPPKILPPKPKPAPVPGPSLGVLRPEAETSSPSRKQQAKSEKRSKSMTLWWAERKKRQAERNAHRLQAPPPETRAEIAPAGSRDVGSRAEGEISGRDPVQWMRGGEAKNRYPKTRAEIAPAGPREGGTPAEGDMSERDSLQWIRDIVEKAYRPVGGPEDAAGRTRGGEKDGI